MRSFKKGSLVLFLCIIGLSLQAQPKPFLDQSNDGLVYNAGFQYKDNYFSGILVIKSIENGQHVVMMSKLGPSILDFIIHNNGTVTWNKKVEAIDKPLFDKALVRDFRTLLLTPLYNPVKIKWIDDQKIKVKKHEKVVITINNERVNASENRGVINLFKTFVTYAYTDEDAIPDEICLTHRNLKLKIELTQLSNE